MSHRLPRFLRYSLAAMLPAAGLLIGLGSQASASTHPTAAAEATAIAKAAIRQLTIGQPTNHRVPGSSRREISGLTNVQSTNWSGYADTGSSFSKITGSWTEPAASCSGRSTSLAAFWVGIDGFSSSSVEQDGTLIECYHGTAFHFSWWEMYPTNAVQEVFAVKVGDKMFASVTYTAGATKPFDILVKDLTSGKSLNKLEACSVTCTRSSAEWIVESPSFGGTIALLPKFKAIKFTAGFASEAPDGAGPTSIASFPHASITMTGSHGNRAVPSALNSTGTGFADKWISSSKRT
jgi:hypothetical protein